MIAQGLWFFDAENLRKTQNGSPPAEVPNAGEVGQKQVRWQEIGAFQCEALLLQLLLVFIYSAGFFRDFPGSAATLTKEPSRVTAAGFFRSQLSFS